MAAGQHPLSESIRARLAAFARSPDLAAAALAGLVIGWVVTSPALSMGINWDAAGYAADLASGRHGWSAVPWSSHYGLGPAYATAAGVAHLLGGTTLDGFRGLGAVCLAASAALIATMARRLCGSRLATAAIVAAFLSSWGVLGLAFTWEDNLLFLPFGLAALSLALARADAWRAADSVLAGAVVGLGTLASWQAGVYLLPALYVATCLGGEGRAPRTRLRDALLLGLALIGARVGWACVFALTSDVPAARLFRVLFARPEPSFFPEGLRGWWELARSLRTVLRHVGLGIVQTLIPGLARTGGALRPYLLSLGAGAFVVALALSVLTAKRAGPRGHLLAVCVALFLLAAAVYTDLPEDKYKRYDFLPGLLLLAAAAAIGVARPRARVLVLVGLLFVTGAQLVGAARANVAFHARLATPASEGYAAREGQTWFAAFRRLRAQTPQACGYVFDFDELAQARWALEIVAALHSELPGAIVLGDPTLMRTWDRPLPMRSALPAPAACLWISPRAQARLAGAT